ncbi:MAG: hypothetical protein ABI064_00160, partial [Acidobacteriaceae bacterium]
DNSNNVWWNTNQGILEWVNGTNSDPNTGAGPYAFTVWQNPTTNASTNKPSGLAFDKDGNLFMSPDAVKKPAVGNIFEYTAAAIAAGSTVSTQPVAVGPTLAGSSTTSNQTYRDLVVDSHGDLVTENTSNSYVYVLQPGGASPVNGYSGFLATNGTLSPVPTNGGPSFGSTDYGAGIDSNGNVFVGGTCCYRAGALFEVSPYQVSGSPSVAATAEIAASPLFAGGGNSQRTIMVDGANNIWYGNGSYYADANNTMAAIGETDNNFNPLSPTGLELTYDTTAFNTAFGYCGGSPAACNTQGGFEKPFFTSSSVYAFALDSSGNVWGAENYTTTAGTTDQGSYWVIVGAAVPVTTLIVANLP